MLLQVRLRPSLVRRHDRTYSGCKRPFSPCHPLHLALQCRPAL